MIKRPHLLRTIICLLLIVIMLMAAGCAGQPSAPTTEGAKPAEFGTPILRFAVTSDVHIRVGNDDMESHKRLEQLISTAYAYSEAQSSYNKLDAILFGGDNTQCGSEEEQTYFFNYLKENVKEGTIARAVMGNHEYNTIFNPMYDQIRKEDFLKYSGYEDINAHLVIKGYHFLLVSLDRYEGSKYPSSTYLSDEQIGWLEKELKIAAEDDPNRPIFVIQHAPPQNTMKGSQKGDGVLKELLSQYPQVIDFGGHTHRSLADPRAIWQETFTALTTGSLAYIQVPIIGVHDGVIISDDDQNWSVGSVQSGPRNGGMYYIVEINENHDVRILIYNIFTESIFGEPYIIDSFDPKDFRYTDARKDSAVKPEFDADAKIEVLSTACDDLQIQFPQAQCKDLVQSYRIEIYQGETPGKTNYRPSGIHYGDDMPETVKAVINYLDPDTEYTFKVYACSSWGIDSEPLVVNIKTTAAAS